MAMGQGVAIKLIHLLYREPCPRFNVFHAPEFIVPIKKKIDSKEDSYSNHEERDEH
jgi:hypothetical protein